MAKEDAPWFAFDAAAFLADENVRAMTLEETGAYVLLLAFAWREHGIPSDPARLARLLKVSPRKFAQMWPALRPCWQVHDDGTMTNRRQESWRQQIISTQTRRERRRVVLKRDGRQCVYCHSWGVPLEIDHVIPRSRGGSDRLENLVPACVECNRAKGTQTADEFERGC